MEVAMERFRTFLTSDSKTDTNTLVRGRAPVFTTAHGEAIKNLT